MKSNDFMTIYAACNEWGISEGFFSVLKSLPKHEAWFTGDATQYGQDLVLKTAIPNIKALYEKTCEEFNNYTKDPNYLNIGGLIKGVTQTNSEIKNMIDSKQYDHLFVKVLRRKKLDPIFGAYIYFFKYDFLEHCENLTTGFLAKLLKKRGIVVSDVTILSYKKEGLLSVKENQYGIDTMSLNEVESLVLAKKKEKYMHSKNTANENSNFSVLNSQQQKIIEEYLSFRKKGGRISHNNYRAKKHIANKEETLAKLRSALATFFFRIICARCNIDQKPKMRYAFLTQDEKEKYDSNKFHPTQISEDDAFAFMTESKTTSAVHVFQTIKPFYAWILQRLKNDALTPDKWFEYGQLELRIESFLNQFPTNYSELASGETINKVNKSFLNREEMIIVREKLLNDPGSHDPYRNATIWELCCVTGTRPYEVRKLKIEYFLLDKEGYIKLNSRGWGELHIPREASKHENSPSHPVLGTVIPGGTVKRVNEYLKRLYKKQKNEPRGKGFLFRPEDLFPEKGYKSAIMTDVMTRLKTQLDFLSYEQRRDFELKASRRSMNNLIEGFGVRLPIERLNGRIQKVAADIQMRHKISGDIGEMHYTAPISDDDFYTVLNHTINFPWNRKELIMWEKELNLHSSKDFEIKSEEKESKKSSQERKEYELNEINSKRLDEINLQLNKLRKRPKGLTIEEWFEMKESLEKEKMYIN